MVTVEGISFLLVHSLNNQIIPIFYSESHDEVLEQLKKFKKERQKELECLNEEDKSFEFVFKSNDHYITHGEEIYIISDKEKVKEIINQSLISENIIQRKFLNSKEDFYLLIQKLSIKINDGQRIRHFFKEKLFNSLTKEDIKFQEVKTI